MGYQRVGTKRKTACARPFESGGVICVYLKRQFTPSSIPTARGLSHCSSHGLRKAVATRLVEAGATDHQLMAWFGWKSISEAQRYTKAESRKVMAASAAALITGTYVGKPGARFAKKNLPP